MAIKIARVFCAFSVLTLLVGHQDGHNKCCSSISNVSTQTTREPAWMTNDKCIKSLISWQHHKTWQCT